MRRLISKNCFPKIDSRHLTIAVLGVVAIVYSYLLVYFLPLETIPPFAYIPPVLLCLYCVLRDRHYFILGFLITGIIGQSGERDIERGAYTELILGETTLQFGTILFYPLAHIVLLLSGIFFLRNFIEIAPIHLKSYFLPICFLFFAFLQLVYYFPTQGTYGILSRTIIIVIILSLTIGFLRFEKKELDSLCLILMIYLSLVAMMELVGGNSGRSGFVTVLGALPIGLFLFRSKSFLYWVLGFIFVIATVYYFIFTTYWVKIMILCSLISLAIYRIEMIRRIPLKLYFWVFPTFTMALALSSLFVDPDRDAQVIAGQIKGDRSEIMAGDFTEFSLSEVRDLVLYKYRGERVIFWRSCLEYTFVPFGIRAIFPEGHVLFEFTTGNWIGLPWTAGPHNGFIYLLRAYGLVVGLIIFGYVHFLIYKILVANFPRESIMASAFQPLLLAFVMCGFSIGDYPISTTGAYTLFVIVGISLNYARLHGAKNEFNLNRFQQ